MKPEDLPLRDLHLPEAVGWWPLAPGWWLLLVLLVAALGYWLWRRFRNWQRGAVRRHALRELSGLTRAYVLDGDVTRLAMQVSALLRRAMLAYAPRHSMAGLTGDDWMQWLDRGLPQAPFSDGPGHQLVTLPYRNAADVDEAQVRSMLDAVRDRLRTPLPGEHG